MEPSYVHIQVLLNLRLLEAEPALRDGCRHANEVMVVRWLHLYY